MARLHAWQLVPCALLITVVLIVPAARSEGHKSLKPPAEEAAPLPSAEVARPVGGHDLVCRVYPLAELGSDPELGQWVLDLVLKVVPPGSSAQGTAGQRTISYYAPGRTLVVNDTPEVQARVADFLDSLKKSLATARPGNPAPAHMPPQSQKLVPAQYVEPGALKSTDPLHPTSGYPAATPGKQPKHLFHFIIRYEGDGIIDSNVVEFMKLQAGEAARWQAPTVSYGAAPAPNNGPASAMPPGTYLQNPPAYAPPCTPATLPPSAGPAPQPDGTLPIPQNTPTQTTPAPNSAPQTTAGTMRKY